MYRRKTRTPVGTSTPKYTAVDESDSGRSTTQSQPLRVPSGKRKENAEEIASKSVKRSKPTAYASYFEEVVAEAGFIFQQGENPHLLCMYLRYPVGYPKDWGSGCLYCDTRMYISESV
jgi:hypothetical protein